MELTPEEKAKFNQVIEEVQEQLEVLLAAEKATAYDMFKELLSMIDVLLKKISDKELGNSIAEILPVLEGLLKGDNEKSYPEVLEVVRSKFASIQKAEKDKYNLQVSELNGKLYSIYKDDKDKPKREVIDTVQGLLGELLRTEAGKSDPKIVTQIKAKLEALLKSETDETRQNVLKYVLGSLPNLVKNKPEEVAVANGIAGILAKAKELRENEYVAAKINLRSIENEVNAKYPFLGTNIFLTKMYLIAQKANMPVPGRYNPYFVNGSDLKDFLQRVIAEAAKNPGHEQVYQCIVEKGHSTLIELRVSKGKLTAVMIDAANDLRSAQENYLPDLTAAGFKVKVFVSDFDKKMLLKDQHEDEDSPMTPARMLASRPNLFGPINFFRRIKPIQLQNDMYSCQEFAVAFAIAAGEGDYLKSIKWPNTRVRAYAKRQKIEMLKDAFMTYKKVLNPARISMLPFSSLPDSFIQYAQSTRITDSRGLTEKFGALDTLRDQIYGKSADGSANINNFFTSSNLLYAVLSTKANLELQLGIRRRESSEESVSTKSRKSLD